ncbi:monosaccharide ABC transporter ATP-binding protein (CUT2 family) [Hydrogenoanaerobacterium saccharovorans]|uniref:Ribose/galactose/methyl galactoside import ATP-binding protein n=1 Tax=Hydrogenoanaerobacterium saccharovorans TaxID=474960 RepID=A0A1H8ANN5_9FIRM|nr:sugar ABC transporter ATP-binding protein [Hydrogenoanaerobacterium saccharovorans]RPF47881.1 monosaccharide ABC transporter ATP-binding protein (CUT2 family) [Hydrogenoanaerobacterium saccharovorans]SEM71379.1 monosaccharide ABC transporter ATP-binding protein, CUT2 family [Hydrogenoanaerobacterium saccharovorans]
MSEYRLEMRNIVKTFPGVKALDGANLQLKPGTVHALMGENGAGKSTLMKCMFGIYKMDSGELYYEGEKITITDPMNALNRGIAMVHQELQPIPERSVAENIFVGRYPIKRILGIPVIDHDKMYKDTEKLLKEVKMNFDPKAKLSTLSVSQMQSVEIAKAVSADCRVLILDEPTSSLTANEVEALFEIIENLKAKGVSIVYISHKMDEILRISDEVTIMRDGQYIGTWESKSITTDMIITKMVGRELTNLYPPRENIPGEVVFEVENYTSINPKSFRNVSFTLRKGEILGVGGLVGAQRTELMEGLFGIRCHEQGTIRYKGQTVTINRPQDAIRKGIALLTEDRRATGIMGVLSVADNVAIASLDKYLDYGIVLNKHKIEKLVQENVAKLSIKTPSSKTLIQSLSGGNQQKVLISRWLANNPDVLILDEPTRGIDVGAKYEIYCIIAELAKQGKSIIMISSEMSELIGMSDRIMVMCDGKVTGFIDGNNANQENVMALATKFS